MRVNRMAEEKFWLDNNYSALVTNLEFVPRPSHTLGEKLNIYSRIILIVGILLALYGWDKAPIFILASILILAAAYLSKGDDLKQGFTLTPTATDPDVKNITVSPLYSEEWQINPPTYDYTSDVVSEPVNFEQQVNPQERPYSQYMTNSNFLPRDDQYIQALGSKSGALTHMNSAFLRHDLAFRDNTTRIFKMKLKNRFKQEGYDTFSPYSGN